MWNKCSAFIGILLISFSVASAADEVQAARAVITGPADRVYEFHESLKEVLAAFLGESDPAITGVSCDLPSVRPGEFNCDMLRGENSDATKIIYTFYRDHARLQAFILSWDRVQSKKLSSDLKLQFDTDTPSGDCGGFQGACVSAPFCPGPPKRCDKAKGPPCTACGT